MLKKATIWVAVLSVLLTTVHAQVVVEEPPEFQDVGLDEHLGGDIPLDLVFVDETGREMNLAEYFDGDRPVIINMVYYTCPMLCNLVLNGQVAALKELDWTPGDQFRVVTVSFDATETHDLAAAKKVNYVQTLEKPGAESGWAFLTGTEDQSLALADALGFKFRWDEQSQQFAHAAAIFVITPDGKISRYLYGIQFNPRDVKLALLEASEGKIGSIVDRFILYCFHYDPDAEGYVVFAGNVMRISGLITVIIFGSFVGMLWVRERRKKVPRAVSAAGATGGDRR